MRPKLDCSGLKDELGGSGGRIDEQCSFFREVWLQIVKVVA